MNTRPPPPPTDVLPLPPGKLLRLTRDGRAVDLAGLHIVARELHNVGFISSLLVEWVDDQGRVIDPYVRPASEGKKRSPGFELSNPISLTP